MLGMKSYAKGYIDGCRKKVEGDVSAFKKLLAASKKVSAGDAKKLDSAVEVLEVAFFNNMVLVLDQLFVHRLRTVEGKDGNPLNEVRVLANSIMYNGNVMSTENQFGVTSQAGLSSFKLSPATSVLKYQAGDEIRVNEAEFLRLSKAFFAEIEARYR
jgi:hypothetical protein